MRPLVKFLLICSMPLASAGVVLGQEPPGARGKGIQDLRDQLEAVRRRSKDLVAGIDTIAAERQRINARVSETAKLIQQSETQLNQIESKIDQLQTQEKQLRGQLEERHGSISALLAQMQRNGRNPPEVMVTKREDALSMVRGAMLLAAAFPELRGEAVALSEQINKIVNVMDNIRDERGKLSWNKHGSRTRAGSWLLWRHSNSNRLVRENGHCATRGSRAMGLRSDCHGYLGSSMREGCPAAGRAAQ